MWGTPNSYAICKRFPNETFGDYSQNWANGKLEIWTLIYQTLPERKEWQNFSRNILAEVHPQDARPGKLIQPFRGGPYPLYVKIQVQIDLSMFKRYVLKSPSRMVDLYNSSRNRYFLPYIIWKLEKVSKLFCKADISVKINKGNLI